MSGENRVVWVLNEEIMREIENQLAEMLAYIKALEALQALKRMLK